MGWNTCGMVVLGRSLEEVARQLPDVFSRTGEHVDLEHATSSSLAPDFALGAAGSAVVLWDPNGRLAVDPEAESLRAELSEGGKLVAVLLSSVLSSYGIRFYEDGELVRAVEYEGSTARSEEGEALSVESDLEPQPWGFDEDWVFAMVHRLTGVGFAELESARYERLALG